MWDPRKSDPVASKTGIDLDRYWRHLAADLLELFGVDTWDPHTWDRPWPWLQSLIRAVLATPPNQILVPNDKGHELRMVWRTRTQQAIHMEEG